MFSPQKIALSLPTPEENLALDDALLQRSEAGLAADEPASQHEWLRFWESSHHFVVLGASGKLAEETDGDSCRRDGVAILRRASGGGTVLQGPGCLNYALVLSLVDRPNLRDVTRCYEEVLGRVAQAFAPRSVEPCGVSDLTVAGVKFSGNAQKRARHALLHHGTILYDFDLSRMERYLPMPAQQPPYRRDRPHSSFCTNLDESRAVIEETIARVWSARDPEAALVTPDLSQLINEKYGNAEWTERF